MMRALVILSLLLIPFESAVAKNKPRQREGNYNISVGGVAQGVGNATVSPTRVNIDATVTAGDNTKGKVSATNLKISKGTFTGTGTAMGQTADFKGRLDAPDDDDERAIRGVRLVCTVKTADGRYLKVMGFIPEYAKMAGGKKDDDDDRGAKNSRK